MIGDFDVDMLPSLGIDHWADDLIVNPAEFMGKFGCSQRLAISFNSLVKVVKYPSSATGQLFRAGMLLTPESLF